MTLVLILGAALFLGGLALGAFVVLVLGIHAEERRTLRHDESPRPRIASASRRVLTTRTGDDRRTPAER